MSFDSKKSRYRKAVGWIAVLLVTAQAMTGIAGAAATGAAGVGAGVVAVWPLATRVMAPVVEPAPFTCWMKVNCFRRRFSAARAARDRRLVSREFA